MAFTTPVYGKFINSGGQKTFYVAGILLVSAYNMLLSFINHVGGTEHFVGVSILLQIIVMLVK